MMATSSAPRYGNTAPQGYAQPAQQAAPAPAQMTAEKLQTASRAVINAYAESVVKSVHQMISKEELECAKAGPNAKGVSTTTIKFDGQVAKVLKIRDLELHNQNTDKEIVRKIGALNQQHRQIFDSILKRTEELFSVQIKDILKIVQAKADGTIAPGCLQTAQFNNSLIVKTYVYANLAKMPDAHKSVILSGIK